MTEAIFFIRYELFFFSQPESVLHPELNYLSVNRHTNTNYCNGKHVQSLFVQTTPSFNPLMLNNFNHIYSAKKIHILSTV